MREEAERSVVQIQIQIQIQGSVGQDGANISRDVTAVQRLLNARARPGGARLAEDGRCGPATVAAVRDFQTRRLGVRSPDGRVDPGGRTLRELAGTTAPPAASRPGTGNVETRREDRQRRAALVDPRVKETALTTRILDDLVDPLSGIRARVIGGYLSDGDQFWKLNYHWEYLLDMVEHALQLPVDGQDQKALQSIRSSLRGCPPEPATGYTSGPVGRPEDRTSPQQAGERYRTLRAAKDSFRTVVRRAGLKEASRRSPTTFDLAAAPVAAPGVSKHGSGYAVDVQGDNAAIRSLCRSLGATLVFDEQSHVHVEFAHGVRRG